MAFWTLGTNQAEQWKAEALSWREIAAGLQREMQRAREQYVKELEGRFIDMEQARMLAKTAMDSLVGATAQIIALSQQMADLQRLGFRPPVPEVPQPSKEDAMVAARLNVDDVDEELAKQFQELRASDE